MESKFIYRLKEPSIEQLEEQEIQMGFFNELSNCILCRSNFRISATDFRRCSLMTECKPQSPDLRHLDISVFAYIKGHMFQPQLNDLEELQN